MQSDEAFENFNKISEQYEDKLALMNEAETRAKVIDRILKECLGWREDCIRREDHVESGYTDYQLLIDGITRIVIEAKRAGDYFEIPRAMNQRSYKAGGVIKTVSNLTEALLQARAYAVDIGCKYAAVFNGHQLIVFATVTAGIPWKDSQLTVFSSFSDIKRNFNLFWNMLAYDNVRDGSLIEIIEKGKELISFRKVISGIHNPDQLWARNELYTYIHPLVSLVFSELLDDQRTDILKNCYVFERSNRSLGDDLQNHFVDKLPHFAENFKIKDIFERANKAGVFEKEYLKRETDNRGSLIILVGGVGSGKSTFLHRYFKIVLAEHENLLWYYIDFRKAPANESALESYIFSNIIDQWYTKYADNLAAKLAALGFSADLREGEDFIAKLFNILHLLGFSITIIFDNVDQLDLTFQEKVFMSANNLSEILKTVTIVALREETFMTSTRVGFFNAYDIPKFHISSPDFLMLISARLNFTIELLKTKTIKYPEEVCTDLIRFFAIIRGSLERENDQSRKLVNFINSISVGNMRDALAMFTYFIKSGNTNVREIFRKNQESGWYQIAFHQFIKSVILGEHKYYSQERSHLMNVLDFDPSLTDSHFHVLRIMNYLSDRYNRRSPIGRGYVPINELINTMSDIGIRREVSYDSLIRLASWKLVELDNQSQENLDNASYAKITSAGEYYLKNLHYEFVYLDSILVDTPISEEPVINFTERYLENPDLATRLKRTGLFVNYLVQAESHEYEVHPEYINSEFTNPRFAIKIAEKFAQEKKGIETDNPSGTSESE